MPSGRGDSLATTELVHSVRLSERKKGSNDAEQRLRVSVPEAEARGLII